MSEFPELWQTARLGELAEINPPKDLVDADSASPMTFIPMASVMEEFGGIDVGKSRPFEEVKKGYVQFRERDVLFAKITPCMENGKIGVVPKLDSRVGYGSTEFHVLRAPAEVDPRWVAHFVSREEFRRAAKRNMSGSAGQLRVPEVWLSEQSIPVPPPKEQQRVVAKLEELISDLEAGIAALERARANLKRYRAAVLKAAVEGRLTEKWRAAHPDAEPAEKLLERILVERRKKWEEAQLKKYAKKGQSAPKGWKDKYPKPVKSDIASLPELPKGWSWASLDQLLSVVTSGSRAWTKYYGRGSCIFVMAGNVRPMRLDLAELQVVDPPVGDVERERTRVQKADVLVTIVGANTGDVCSVDDDLQEHYVCQSVALLRPVDSSLSGFLSVFLNAEGGGKTQFRRVMYGQGRPHLGLEEIRNVAVALPPMREQEAISEELERQFSICDVAEAQASLDTKRSSRLRQSILKRAFEGKLVPQDPRDEPASELLARIRRARADKVGEVGVGRFPKILLQKPGQYRIER